MKRIRVKPKFNKYNSPKIGLIALSSDYIIERDFKEVLKNKNIDLFVNRIQAFNPLNKKWKKSDNLSVNYIICSSKI